MKTIIYYFSGTGSNLFLAKEIASILPDTVIRPIKDLEKNKKMDKSYDWIGFIGPSYFSHIPPYMKKCMCNVEYTSQQKIFLICGCGGNRGLAIQDMRQMVSASGKEVNLEYMSVQPGNYLLSYGAFPKFYQKLSVHWTKRKVKHIVKDIRHNKKRKSLKPGFLYKTSYEERLQQSISKFPTNGKHYQVSNQCVKCGMCVKICPVDNITMKDGKVVFGDHCNQCMACIQWCKQRAISFDEKEKNRKRYHHPEITIKDMIQR